jgi:organic hydroperoxide reductase OsmC/OhrA
MAHRYTANVVWERGSQTFTDRKYSRAHELRFDGGTVVPGSSSPSVVKLPLSREDAVDPEEALVAALSACHMLFFLDFAAKAGFRIDRYEDAAEGEMGKGADGKVWLTKVTLKPRITWSGDKMPTTADIDDLHHQSHDLCYIANSVKSDVVVAPTDPLFA